MSKIKICGLKTMEDIEAVNEAKPDYCGFIVEVSKSRRSITRQQLENLVQELDKEIIPVGVFVNAPKELVKELLDQGIIAMAQLHGDENKAYIEYVQESGKPVIKAFSVKNIDDIVCASESPADYVLLDQGTGGTGQAFDWSMAKAMTRPYFLAGGLNASNMVEAVKTLNPWALDLSSGVETDGVKDREKIIEAVKIIRTNN